MSQVVNINDTKLPIEELHLAFLTHKLRNEFGFLESSKNNAPVNGDGEVMPLYTYPCYEYLNSIDWSGSKVFEFGCGPAYHLVRMNEFNNEVNLNGADWTISSQKIIKFTKIHEIRQN